MPILALPLAVTLGLLGAIAGLLDLRYRRIPNWLVIAGFCTGIVINLRLAGLQGGRTALLGAGLAAAIYLPLYLLRAVGGGDLKLMVAVGAIAGPPLWFLLFILTSLLGGVIAVLLVLAQARIGRTVSNIGVILQELLHLRPPYKARTDLDVTTAAGIRLPHGLVIAGAIGLYLAGACISEIR